MKASAKKAIEQIPELYFSKLSEAAFIFKGKEKYEAAEKQKWISLEQLLQMCSKLSECYKSENRKEDAVKELKLALKLIDTLVDEPKIPRFAIYIEYFNKEIARIESI